MTINKSITESILSPQEIKELNAEFKKLNREVDVVVPYSNNINEWGPLPFLNK